MERPNDRCFKNYFYKRICKNGPDIKNMGQKLQTPLREEYFICNNCMGERGLKVARSERLRELYDQANEDDLIVAFKDLEKSFMVLYFDPPACGDTTLVWGYNDPQVEYYAVTKSVLYEYADHVMPKVIINGISFPKEQYVVFEIKNYVCSGGELFFPPAKLGEKIVGKGRVSMKEGDYVYFSFGVFLSFSSIMVQEDKIKKCKVISEKDFESTIVDFTPMDYGWVKQSF